ncbi:MAG: hypothetical protein RLZZ127_3123, partial [Planctomycetota bacterium]
MSPGGPATVTHGAGAGGVVPGWGVWPAVPVPPVATGGAMGPVAG